MKLRMNLFGVVMNGGLAVTIGVILISAGHILFSMGFFVIAAYHIMHLKKVEVTQDAILIRYPLALLNRHKTIPANALVSYRFSGGHYTESGAVFVKYRNGNSTGSMKIPVEPFDSSQLEALFSIWLRPS